MTDTLERIDGLALEVADSNISNKTGWTLGAGLARIPTLVRALRAFGIEPTDAKAWESFVADTSEAPVDPIRLLGCEPAEVVALAQRLVLREQVREQLNRFHQDARLELHISMAAEVDDYLDQLRPRFDAAAADARACAEAGVLPSDSIEAIMRRGGDSVTAWLAYTDGRSVARLDAIAQLRALISLTLGVPPINEDEYARIKVIDYIPTLTKPHMAGPAKSRDSWRYWLQLAPNLHLCSVAESTAAYRRSALSDAELAVADARVERDNADVAAQRAQVDAAVEARAALPAYAGGF